MGLITSPFSFASTAVEVAAQTDMTERRVVVTGASSDIGVETARALAQAGAEVTLAVRDLAAGRRAADDIRRATGNDALHVAELDLGRHPFLVPCIRSLACLCAIEDGQCPFRGRGDALVVA